MQISDVLLLPPSCCCPPLRYALTNMQMMSGVIARELLLIIRLKPFIIIRTIQVGQGLCVEGARLTKFTVTSPRSTINTARI